MQENLPSVTAPLLISRKFLFQGLIVGSGIDWASDEEMKRLVLSLGETLEFA